MTQALAAIHSIPAHWFETVTHKDKEVEEMLHDGNADNSEDFMDDGGGDASGNSIIQERQNR